jgi:uncharacterized protein Veg
MCHRSQKGCKIFLLLGAPVILQSDNGTEFTTNVISELKEFWPSLMIVHGKPRHPKVKDQLNEQMVTLKTCLWLGSQTMIVKTGLLELRMSSFLKKKRYRK